MDITKNQKQMLQKLLPNEYFKKLQKLKITSLGKT